MGIFGTLHNYFESVWSIPYGQYASKEWVRTCRIIYFSIRFTGNLKDKRRCSLSLTSVYLHHSALGRLCMLDHLISRVAIPKEFWFCFFLMRIFILFVCAFFPLLIISHSLPSLIYLNHLVIFNFLFLIVPPIIIRILTLWKTIKNWCFVPIISLFPFYFFVLV